jgi:hypothetical protein
MDDTPNEIEILPSLPGAAESRIRYEYRCVAAPAVVTIRRAKERLSSVQMMEDVLNREAKDGWDYVGVDDLSVIEPQGFWTRKKMRTSFKVLVFRRPL